MNQMLNSPVAAFAVDLAIDVLLKGTVLLITAGLAAWALRGASAAMRHAVWSVGLASLLALPVLSVAFPPWSAEPLHLSAKVEAVAALGDKPAPVRPPPGSRSIEAETPAATEVTSLPAAPGSKYVAGSPAVAALPALLLAMWAIGVIVILGRLGLDALRVVGITRRAVVCRVRDVRVLAGQLAEDMSIRRPVRLLESDDVRAPISWGAITPVIIVPGTVTGWTTEQARVALLHELAHVRRWDYGVLLMVEVVRALYWFNPLVWLAARGCAIERERACDDNALHHGIRSDIYASHLVDFARAQLAARTPRAAFAMAQPSTLSRRIRGILKRGVDRAPAPRSWIALSSLLALLIAFPVATCEVWGDLEASDSVKLDRQDTRDRQGTASHWIQDLEDDDPLVRRYAAWALGELETDRGVKPLTDRLRDDEADVRLVSAWALGEIKDRAAVDPLIELLEDRDPLVREMAVLALGEIGHGSAVESLIHAAQRQDDLADAAIWALGEINTGQAYDARRSVFEDRGMRSYPNEEVWTGRLGTTRPLRSVARDLSRLTAALQDGDPEVRRAAAEALGLLGDDRAVESLLDALRDPASEVRALAVWALDEINPSREGR